MKYLLAAVLLFLTPLASFAIGPITGASRVCVSDLTHLSDTSAGGTWSSSNPAVASVDPFGNVTGYSTGTTTISYSIGASHATLSMIVTPGISSVTGASDLCFGTTQSFSDSTAGGIWSSSNSLIATVGSTSGIVNAVSQGAAVISYTSGSCYASKTVSVSAPPRNLAGCDNVGVGDSLVFYGIIPDSIYLFSSDNSIASYDLPSGKIIGESPGTATITLLNPTTGCVVATRDITVTPSTAIQPIAGNVLVCSGNSSTLSDPTPGGIWSSGNTSVATVSSTGIVQGISGGEITISYAVVVAGDTSTCTTPFFSNSLPAEISGPSSVCAGDTIILTSNTGGSVRLSAADIATADWYYYGPVPGGYAPGNTGIFTSSDTTKARVIENISSAGITTTGYIKGISGGPSTITFTDVYTGCAVTKPVTVNTAPVVPLITGTAEACVTGTSTLSDALAGGKWISSATYIASVDSVTGMVTGESLGVDTIRYAAFNSCGTGVATKLFTVNGTPPAVPGAITGQASVCMGASVTLHDTTAGGTWSSSTPSIATINGATGVVTSVVPGATVIIYTVTNSCGSSYITTTETVDPVPAAITGTTGICMGARTTLNDSVRGGTWTTSAAFVANIVPGSGLLTGVGAGTAIITYTVGGALCRATTIVTVNPLPTIFSVTGGGSFCSGGTGVHVMLSGSSSGVNYQLFKYGAPIGGAVTGAGTTLDMGIETSGGVYTVGATDPATGCTSNMSGSTTVTVNPLPTAYTVSGGGSYCLGGTGFHIFLVGSRPGTNYQLYNGVTMEGTPVAGTGSALDFGLYAAAGTYTVTAINTATGCTGPMSGSTTIIINPVPSVYRLTGGGGYCTGGTGVHIGLDSSNTGVYYQLYHGVTAIGGHISGINAPLDLGLESTTGSYTVKATNPATGCTSIMSGTDTVSINPLPTAYPLTGGGSYCIGGTGFDIVLGGSHPGTRYQLYDGTTATGSPLAGTGTSLDYGLHTPAGTYTVVATDTATGCTRNMVGSATITIDPAPTAYTMTGGGSYCAGGIGVSIGLDGSDAGTQYQLYYGTVATGIPAIGTGGGIDFGTETGAGSYTVIATDPATTCAGNMAGSESVSINPSPSIITGFDTLTIGGTTVLTDSVAGGTWTSSNTNATVDATGIVTGDSLGRDTIIYTLSSGCSVYLAVTVDPAVITISGIKPVTNNGGITIYPNPASNNFNIQWQNQPTAKAVVLITDMAGQEVYSSEITINISSGKTQVDLTNFKNGIYLISVNGNGIYYKSKLMIER